MWDLLSNFTGESRADPGGSWPQRRSHAPRAAAFVMVCKSIAPTVLFWSRGAQRGSEKTQNQPGPNRTELIISQVQFLSEEVELAFQNKVN